MDDIDFEKDRRVIRGPYELYGGSITVEFLEPDGIDATFLSRVTISANHTLNKQLAQGKRQPLTPPLHLHFDQAESFKVLQGKWGMTGGYEQKQTILTPECEVFTVPAMLPHFPWPAYCEEDSIVLAWAHPTGVPKPLDVPFFEQIFLYTSDCFEKSKAPDPLQMILMQHETNSAMVIFPSLTFLGPLRWWIPWKLEGAAAALARLLGYSQMIPGYLKEE